MKFDTTSLAGIVSYGDTPQSEVQNKLQQVRDITNNTKQVMLFMNKKWRKNRIENSIVEINDSSK
jgi:lipopolysaccharide biosynthesis glycosyltransferase